MTYLTSCNVQRHAPRNPGRRFPRINRVTLLIVLVAYALAIPLSAFSQTNHEDVAGRVVAQVGGEMIELPMLDSSYAVNIEGDMATVELRQTFSNPSQIPLEAEYLFPLNQNAAVFGMTMHVGDEIVRAVIREKQVAEAEYKQAASEGKAAALLTQHRPNMFTQKIANLMPGLPVEVTLKYVQMVPKIDGQYELVIPMIVGPRYESPAADQPAVAQDDDAALQNATWTISPLPAYPQVAGLDLPDSFLSDRVSLDVTMVAGVEVSQFASPTHPLDITDTDDGLGARFTQGKVMDNKDLILRYMLGGEALQAASLTHHDERGGFLSVMIEPPAIPNEATATPRELVFVLDTSGSMSGQPMAASKRFMDAALKGLRPDDYFRIIPFSDTARHFAQGATPATSGNIKAGRKFVSKLTAGGGTEIDNAIHAAFATSSPANTMRIVVFLSDGYIGGEAQVLRTIREQIGQARIYAFGIGSSVNRYLLDAMAEEGRGYVRYVGLDEDAMEVAEIMAANLKTPLLTDIEIDWGELEVSDMTPARIPDLFAGNSLRVYARYKGADQGQVMLKGLVQGRKAQMPVKLVLSDQKGEAALPLIWARNQIATMERRIAVRDRAGAADAEITRLGLEFSLQTKNTSFVAVSQKVVNDTDREAGTAGVPLPMVSGASEEAYPQGFSGSSAPEPEAMLGMILVAVMTLLGLRPRRMKQV
ncbi:VIT and VWA domain-containing protein [Aliiroseovarius crassostreae]|uniref:VIT and vWA domain-containing protein n=1 Tax=Aliiroseovarius crassostreae TaxID=154981 RepID=UPI00220B7DB5|nr:VIT and VWA domain-containing protein [Aliiroseovarius crassostreae]UWQ04984.1 VIT and VWA domain-containing protein [Aliiroseovarius crassostreae]